MSFTVYQQFFDVSLMHKYGVYRYRILNDDLNFVGLQSVFSHDKFIVQFIYIKTFKVILFEMCADNLALF